MVSLEWNPAGESGRVGNNTSRIELKLNAESIRNWERAGVWFQDNVRNNKEENYAYYNQII